MAEIEVLSLGRIPMLTDFGRDDESNGERLANCRDGAQHMGRSGDFQYFLGRDELGVEHFRCGSCEGVYLFNAVR